MTRNESFDGLVFMNQQARLDELMSDGLERLGVDIVLGEVCQLLVERIQPLDELGGGEFGVFGEALAELEAWTTETSVAADADSAGRLTLFLCAARHLARFSPSFPKKSDATPAACTETDRPRSRLSRLTEYTVNH